MRPTKTAEAGDENITILGDLPGDLGFHIANHTCPTVPTTKASGAQPVDGWRDCYSSSALAEWRVSGMDSDRGWGILLRTSRRPRAR